MWCEVNNKGYRTAHSIIKILPMQIDIIVIGAGEWFGFCFDLSIHIITKYNICMYNS